MPSRPSRTAQSGLAVVILAAGRGTRMKTRLPKVMHRVACRPMLAHVIATAEALKPRKIVCVIAPDMAEVGAMARQQSKNVSIAIQDKQLGTGHAMRCAEKALKGFKGTMLMLYGDTPLITPEIAKNLISKLKGDAAIAILGMQPDDPAEYGRMIVKDGELLRIVEYVDATAEERRIGLCNSGVLAAKADVFFSLLAKVKNNNAKGEYYVTDTVPIARSQGLRCVHAEAEAHDLAGVNTRAQLAEAEYLLQERLRESALRNGVTMTDPSTVHLCTDTQFGTDVVIHPNVFFGPGVKVGSDVEIRSFCHLEGCHVADHVIIGPFARLRPGTALGKEVHIGNFVELKQAKVAEGAKINHLSYVGDAEVGARANVGAGTITCNYDGYQKHKTVIGAESFIGSNTALVAPVSVGKGAVIGAGSVITENVPEKALALTRPAQVVKKAWKKKTVKKKKR